MNASVLRFHRVSRGMLGLSLALISMWVLAADNITVVSSKLAEIPLYGSSDGVQQVGTLPATGLPIQASEEKNGFLRVDVGGKSVWVDSMNVKLSRKVVAGCGGRGGADIKVAGELGAGTERCK